MDGFLKQSTAAQIRTIGPFVDSTDFKTVKNALTIANTDIKLKKNGAASGSKNSGGATADGTNGEYHLTWDATDTDTVGQLSWSVNVAGALVAWGHYTVLIAEVYDDLFGSSAVGYLKPTTAGRDLDVTATGEAGIDWSNIGGPTTSQTLSGTTIGTATAVTTVNGLAAGVITATSIAADAITAAKVADGTIDAATFAASAITATAIASNAITSAKIATDAIGAAQLAADAVTEIQSGLATSASIVTLQADTDNIQTRLPTSLVSGRMDSSVGAMAADTLTASALAADAVTEIQSGLATSASITTLQADTDDIQTRLPAALTADGNMKSDTLRVGGTLQTAGDIIGDTNDIQARLPAALVSGRIDASVGAMAANVITAASINTGAIDADALATDAVNEIADGVWDEALAGHTTAGSAGKALSDAGAAGDPWATTLPGAYGAGTAGFIVGTNLDDTISSRSSQSSVDTIDSNVDAIKLKTDQLTFTTPNQVDSTVVTNSDKVNYTTTSTDKQESADELLDRNLAGGASGNTRNVRNALRTLRNKVAVVAAVATVYEEDDTTPAFTADVTTTAGNPITAVDPTT